MKATLRFGRYSTFTWKQVPPTYLQWLVDNHSDAVVRGRAQRELVSRWRKGEFADAV